MLLGHNNVCLSAVWGTAADAVGPQGNVACSELLLLDMIPSVPLCCCLFTGYKHGLKAAYLCQ